LQWVESPKTKEEFEKPEEESCGFYVEYHPEAGKDSEKKSRKEIKWIKAEDEIKLNDDETFSIVVSGLEPWTSYEFRVIAVNKFGSVSNDPITLKTMGPPESPAAPKIFRKTQTSLDLMWKAPKKKSKRMSRVDLKDLIDIEYRLQYDKGSEGQEWSDTETDKAQPSKDKDNEDTFRTVLHLDAGTAYQFRLVASSKVNFFSFFFSSSFTFFC